MVESSPNKWPLPARKQTVTNVVIAKTPAYPLWFPGEMSHYRQCLGRVALSESSMPEAVPGSLRGVVNRYRESPSEVQGYFEAIPALIENYDWEVSIGFMFMRLEKALNTMLYCGARKLHRAHAETAYRFVDQHHMTRKEFRRLFRNVFGEEIPKELVDTLSEAEKVRDKIIHGKTAVGADKRKAIVQLIAYAEGMNDLVDRLAGFRPFTTDLRGFAGSGEALNAPTTAWLMKGLGFTGRASDDAAASGPG